MRYTFGRSTSFISPNVALTSVCIVFPGSSLSPITNNHSFHTDVAFNKTARDELTEDPESRPIATGGVSAILRNETNDFAAGTVMDQGIEAKGCTIEHVSEALSSNGINPTAETVTPRSSANDSCKRFESSSCIASGLRRSSRPKRFLYPTSSHVTKSDDGKRSRETTVAVDSLSSPREDKATAIEKPFQERVNDETDNDATDEKTVTKKIKVDEICEPDRYTAVVPSVNDAGKDSDKETKSTMSEAKTSLTFEVYERNGTSKTDDVLFDMDALSQFPVETLLSPPHANCAKDGLNVLSCSSPKPEMNVTYTIESKETGSSIGKRDLSFHSNERDKCVSDSLNEFTQAKAGGMAAVNRESEREHPVTTLREQTPFANNEHSCCRGNGLVERELQQLGACEEISSYIKKDASSSAPAEFLGFSTASGKQVHVSEAAFRKARKTLLEIDTELNLNRSVPTRKGGEPYFDRATNKQRTSERDGDGTLLDCQKLPFKRAGNIVATASTISLDGVKKRKREEFPRVVLCTASASANENDDLQNVDEVKTKQTDDYNDSLLEDLLNDCKRKRRDSLKTITEENERIKMVAEVKKPIPDSNGPHVLRGSSGGRDGSNTQCLKSAPISEAAVINSTTVETDNNLSSERQSSGGFLNIPITAVKTKKNSLFASKCKNEDNICEMLLKDSSEEHCDKVRETSSLVSNVGHFHFASENDINNNGIPGLQSASGKNLQLSGEALNKAASIMHQVDSCDERNEEHGDPLSLEKATFLTRQELSEQGKAKKKENTTKFGGFQTASGKKLMLSTEALQKGVEIMQQIDKSLQTLEKVDSKLSSESMNNRAKTTQGTETCLEGGKRNSASYHPISTAMDDELSKEENGTSISGFQTASGKRVTLSNEALQKVVSIMKQIEKSPTKGNCAPYLKRTGGFSGFQTASGIGVKMSREAMEKGAMIMQKIEKSFDESKFHRTSCQSGKTSFAGFQTTSGQIVTFSKEALGKGTVIMQQTDRSLAQSKDDNASWQRSKTGFSGFQTPSVQKVTFSEEALKKGTAIMQRIDRSLAESKENTAYWQNSNTGFSGFQTASGQKVTLSEEGLEKGTAIIQQIDKSLEESKANIASCQRSKTAFSGFQTVSGQEVTFSEEALEKGTAIIQQIDISLEESKANTASCQRGKTSFSGFQTASGQKVTFSKDALEKGTAIIQQIDKSLEESKANPASCQRSKTCFSGFQTASGQKVTFSEEALEKGTAIIQQIDKSLEESKANPTSCQRSNTCFSGFQTASGQKVTFSEEALEKGTAIMQQIDKCLEESKVNITSCQRSKTVFSGFQTASGRSVELSKEALDKGTVIMKQIDKSLEWSTKSNAVSSRLSRSGFISEFQPESRLSAEKSGETLEKAAKLVNLTDKTFGEKVDKGQPCTTSRSTFSGFQTAAGNSVQISDSALAKARETMASIDSHNCSVSSNLGNPPFHTEPKRNSTAPAVSFGVEGVVMPLSVESHLSEHDQVVTREVLESSEALLADESFMDLSEYLNEKEERSAAERSSFDTSEGDVSFEERRTVKRQSGNPNSSHHRISCKPIL